eukprot:TRINITY_DN19827_c0_g1_i4.p2 TRINITY_DN19827_c0_g1~~TRINITY_DN19827_c0_g1_i4.p2  ORF type:complete len:167 (-),score=34.43 TRINITY_DN19827_c0_g1_i4:97-531(-)
MSASIYGGAVVLTSALGWNLYFAAGACIILSAFYTISGGLRAVMYTDMLQMMIFVFGGFVVLGIALHKVGGTTGLQNMLDERNATGLVTKEVDRSSVDDFVIKWKEIFAVADEEQKYSWWIRYLLYAAAISVLIVIFSLWIVYA